MAYMSEEGYKQLIEDDSAFGLDALNAEYPCHIGSPEM